MSLNFALKMSILASLIFLFSCTPHENRPLPQDKKEIPDIIASFEWSGRYNDGQGFPHSISGKLENLHDSPDGYLVNHSILGNVTQLDIICNGKNAFCDDSFTFSLRFPSTTTGSHQLDVWSETQTIGYMVKIDGESFGSTNGLLQITSYSDNFIEGSFSATCFQFDDSRVTPIISGTFGLKLDK